jgi:hypothetical protein
METPEEALARQYKELCLEFAGGMAEKMAEIDAGLASLRAASDAPATLAALKIIEAGAHRLAGGGSTFGFPQISRAAAPLDSGARKLGREAAPDALAAAAALSPLVDALRALVANPGEPQI